MNKIAFLSFILGAALTLSAISCAFASDPSQVIIEKRTAINQRIKEGLRENSSAVYRLFGMDKIMRQLHLSNVKGGESAYCFTPSMHTNVPAGCYVEFYIMQNKRNYLGIWHKNNLCGALVRWYAPWDNLNRYEPNSGMAHFISDHNIRAIPEILDEDWHMCQNEN